MCDKCVEIDKSIERYRRIILSIGDQITVERTKELIADLEAQKDSLHPINRPDRRAGASSSKLVLDPSLPGAPDFSPSPNWMMTRRDKPVRDAPSATVEIQESWSPTISPICPPNSPASASAMRANRCRRDGVDEFHHAPPGSIRAVRHQSRGT
jgi:hypothetical protein